MTMIGARPAERTPGFVLAREYAAPRNRLWHAWTEPTLFARWYRPGSFTVRRIEVDVRPGGAIRCDMRDAGGAVLTNLGTFTEVIEPERLGLTMRSEHQGQIVLEHAQAITFAVRGNATVLTLELCVLRERPEVVRHLADLEATWYRTLDKLAELVTA